MLVVFLFLNSWRSTVITGVALPISVLASFIAVWALGFKLETMSLLGLSLAIGILIDDAIVVRENIVRHVEMGKDHFRAAHDGTDEIGLAVAATTFSILAVFVPIGFMPGIGGQWFKPFALTIACSVAVSLFVSFSLDPMLSAYWADPHKAPHERGWITRQLDKFNAWFNRAGAELQEGHRVGARPPRGDGDDRGADVLRVVLPADARPQRAWPRRWSASRSSSSASREARHARGSCASVVVGASVSAVFVDASAEGARRFAPSAPAFFPEDDRAEFIMALETPPGSNMEYTRLKAEEAARIARAHPEVLYTYTTLGNSATGGVDEGNIYVRTRAEERSAACLDRAARRSSCATRRRECRGATISVFTNDFSGGFKQIQLQLRGQDVAALAQAADMVKAEVEKVPGAVDIGLSTKGQKPELEIDLNRGVAGSLGLTVGQVAQSLRPAFAGIDAGYWIDPTRQVAQGHRASRRPKRGSARRISMQSADGGDRARTARRRRCRSARSRRFTQGVGPAIIDHLNREPVVTVELNTSGRAAGDVTNDIHGAARQDAASRRACATRSAATPSRRPKCSARSSRRSGSRCC